MTNAAALAIRNIKLFTRDRMAVFFSFLSSVIVLALYFLFIANAIMTAMEGEGFPLSTDAGYFLIYLQMMAGVMVINSMSLSVGVFTVITRDFENRRADSFLLTPVRAGSLIAGYFAAGLIVPYILNVFVWAVTSVLIGLLTGHWVTAVTFAVVTGILFLVSLISSSVMLLIAALLKSPAAVSIVASVSGTFIGFLSGIYMPYSQMGKGTEMVGSVLPFTHMAIWLKQTVLADAFGQLDVPENMRTMFTNDVFSARNIGFLGLSVPQSALLVGCGVFALICLLLAWASLGNRMGK